MNIFRRNALYFVIFCMAVTAISKAHGDFATTVPISAEMASNIISNLFPVAVKINETNLFLTRPKVQFLNGKRIGMLAQIQAYDHRPDQGIAISEVGDAHISGELDYDRSNRQIILRNSSLDGLKFERKNAASERFLLEITAAWNTQVTNLIRTEIPPHPYLLLFRENIQNISYDGSNINLEIGSSESASTF